MRTTPLAIGCGPKVRCIGSGTRAPDDLVTHWHGWPPGQRERGTNAICPVCGRELMLSSGNRYYRHKRPLNELEAASYAAAVENRERRPSQREQVLKAIGEAREGLTNEEMSKRTGIPIQSICARRNELVRDGLIENRPGEMRTTKSGAKATVWRVK